MLRLYLIGGASALAVLGGGGLYIKHLWHVIDGKNAALREASAALKVASQAISDRDAAILRQADHERLDATDASKFWKGQTRAAFDAGRATCPGAPKPDGVQHDLRALWEAGAFKAPGAVPGKPDRGH